jgi:ankyrin repeat protein
LDTLRHCLPPSIRRTLKELPESLDETYERVLRDIKKPNRDLAHRLLQCLVVAIRPLRVKELVEVLAVDFDDGEGTPKLNSSWRWEDHEHALLLSCSSLIAIVGEGDPVDTDRADGDSRVVQFSHFSVKEFLTSPRLTTPCRDISRFHIDLEPSHTVMAQACLGVLLRLDDSAENGVRNSSSLTGYAAEYWVAHAQFQNVSSRVRDAMECLFDLDKPYFSVWCRLYDVDEDSITSPLFWFTDSKLDAGPLYYAALCGFQDLVQKLIIKYPHLVNATGGYCQTPALAALARRHFELVRILHRNGSALDLRGWNERSPLHSAAERGDSEIVQVLIDWKLDINAKCNLDQTPLHLALQDRGFNYFETIQLLLEYGADPNARKYDGTTPLHLASSLGTVEDLRLLLKYGADVEAVDDVGRTARQVASERGHDEITKLLSACGAKDIS